MLDNGVGQWVSKKLLDINIKKIDFDLNKLDQIYINEAKKLLPGSDYIGFSITQGNKYRKKSWPLENFIILSLGYLISIE